MEERAFQLYSRSINVAFKALFVPKDQKGRSE